MVSGAAQLHFGGEVLHLLPGRAAWWPRRRALLIADAHVGKGGFFRAQGIAVPRGSSGGTLERLSRLVQQLDIARVYSLGDFLHAAPTAAVVQSLDNWRARHPDLRMALIPGNHDRILTELEFDGWTIASSPDTDALKLRHEPVPSPKVPTICGHLHPVLRLGSGRADRLTTAVFWLSGKQLILPAFGNFTGGFAIRPNQGDRVFAVGPDAVLEVSRTKVPKDGTQPRP